MGIKLSKNEKELEKLEKEVDRIKNMCTYEFDHWDKGYTYIAGIDEVGRGPLAGPVVAAAVILPQKSLILNINDSKKLSEKKREELFDIINNEAVTFGIGMVDEKIIDRINILNATKQAMYEVIKKLRFSPDALFIDAIELKDTQIPQLSIIKGDSKSISIAAASIIAKVTRDRLMDKYDLIYPQYGFAKHKGYGTAQHIQAIKNFGICPIHRISFTKKFV